MKRLSVLPHSILILTLTILISACGSDNGSNSDIQDPTVDQIIPEYIDPNQGSDNPGSDNQDSESGDQGNIDNSENINPAPNSNIDSDTNEDTDLHENIDSEADFDGSNLEDIDDEIASIINSEGEFNFEDDESASTSRRCIVLQQVSTKLFKKYESAENALGFETAILAISATQLHLTNTNLTNPLISCFENSETSEIYEQCLSEVHCDEF